MSTQPDARDDLQDPQLAQWYRESGGPEPSAALDQAVLAAAHREVHARPRSARSALRDWRVPLSLAAVVVLSVTVVTLVTEHGGELADMRAPPRPEERAPQLPGATRTQPEPVEGAPAGSAESAGAEPGALGKRRSDELVPAPAAPPAAAPAPVAPVRPEQGERASPREALRERPATGRPSMEAIPRPTEAQTSAAASPPAGASGAVGSAPDSEPGRREDARPAASARDDTAPAAAPVAKKVQALEQGLAAPGVAAPAVTPGRVSPPVASPFNSQTLDSAVAEQRSLARSQAAAKPMPRSGEVAQLLKALENQPPERWLEKIEELRRAGRNAVGEELLAAFRRRFPEHPGAKVR